MFVSLTPSLESALTQGSVDEVLHAAMEHFGCQAGTVHRVDEGLLKLSAHSGIPPQIVEIVTTVPIGKGIAGLAAEHAMELDRG